MSKVKEFVPPEIEFANDPMMCELHMIGLKMYEETKNISDYEWAEYIHKKVQESAEKPENY